MSGQSVIRDFLIITFVLIGLGVSGGFAEVKKSEINKGLQSAAQKTTSSPSSGEDINWQVIAGGGTDGTSMNFKLQGTVGQTSVGVGNSANYGLSHGFWQSFGGGQPGCCMGLRGNVDSDGSDQVNVADLTYLVDFLFRGGPAPACTEEANVNGDGAEQINVADLTYLIDYLFRGGPPAPACP